MGCVSSTLLSHNDEFPQLGSAGLGHHIVSLTSTTYGLLTLDSSSFPARPDPSPTPPEPPRGPTLPLSDPEVINSWELMAGLENDSFRFSALPPSSTCCNSKLPPLSPRISLPNPNSPDKENLNPNPNSDIPPGVPLTGKYSSLDGFERLCPPNGGENRVILYTTTLRGVRETYEACNAVRAAIVGLGVPICERDISMDRGFREELRELLKEKGSGEAVVPPRLFVKGTYLGGAEQVLRIHEEGLLGELLQDLDLPRVKMGGQVCDGCGGVRFLPCFQCNGSCKMVITAAGQPPVNCKRRRTVVVRCSDCNENGLVLCPICT
ncbi:hypothetical protein Dimus_034839 [Dionaea muscipula]